MLIIRYYRLTNEKNHWLFDHKNDITTKFGSLKTPAGLFDQESILHFFSIAVV